MGDYSNADDVEPMSEVDLVFQKLAQQEVGKRVFIPGEDPIGLYNHCIVQFNARCNRTTDAPLDKLDPNCFYKMWMTPWYTRLQCWRNPFFICIAVIFNMIISMIPVANLVLFIIQLIVYIIWERQYPMHKRNEGKVSDPFAKMIHSNEVCRRVGLTNMYYNIPKDSLNAFGLKSDQVSKLQSQSPGGTALFMVYNDKFKAAFTRFWFLRVFHLINLITCIIMIVLSNVFIYPAFGTTEFF